MSTSQFTPGQRYVSEAEPELGIGILISHDKRSLTFHFPLAESTRCYSKGSAPIQRVIHKTGDRIQTESGEELVVESTDQDQGLMVYLGENKRVMETELSLEMGFSLPQEKLMAGLAGEPKAFALRRDLLSARAAQQMSPCRGFLGGRLDLIPHQYYIAGEVCRRHAPRVMLSDETGLGKTIEACLIAHHLLVTHQISRILIIVPDALVHQWFVELYRKFNLSFHIFDRNTPCPEENPFLAAQHGIIAQSLLQGDTPHG
ncbi:MAG: SNF2-related protein, partial [Desulfobacterales bacterium]|nr:SNF2-related protein [Desulfobacterales bacterium]